MKSIRNGKRTLLSVTLLLILIVVAGLMLRGQSTTSESVTPSPVFSPAHASLGQALREFFWIRSKPVQPIAYTHTVHVLQQGMNCTDCHVGVDKGPMASIPGVSTCMTCHEDTATDKPEIQKLAAYQERGEDIPWQRVYGFPPISHVRFNHAPHFRANVECATCHGDIPHMTTAQRVVDHTMGFCEKCHDGKQAPNDCMTCHY
jgi:Cytochrome c7 and related cytochrome c